MKYLIDTHTFLWILEDSPNLSMQARSHLRDAQNILFLSIASIWEIAIKISLGKFNLTSASLDQFVAEQLQKSDILLMNITLEHIKLISTLPFHHKDPFDRMLIAQSMAEGIPIISADTAFDAYGVRRLW